MKHISPARLVPRRMPLCLMASLLVPFSPVRKFQRLERDGILSARPKLRGNHYPAAFVCAEQEPGAGIHFLKHYAAKGHRLAVFGGRDAALETPSRSRKA